MVENSVFKVVTKANDFNPIDLGNMTFVKNQAIDSFASSKLWFYQILRENPIALMLDWMPRGDQKASTDLAQVLIAVL